MSIIRLIHIKVQPDQAAEAERIWKEECAPLMIGQKGCLSEQLLKCADNPGELISYAEWESQADIDRYRASPDHKKIRSDALKLPGAQAVTKLYTIVG